MAKSLKIETLTHDEASRKNAPTAELEAFVPPEVKRPILAAYERRNPDLDPQLVWRGKDVADWSDLVVNAPPLYIQEKIHPKAIIEGLKRYKAPPRNGEGDHAKHGGGAGATGAGFTAAGPSTASRSPSPAKAGEDKYEQIDLFADFNGIDPEARTEFYAHDQHWSNRMILGDGLQVMASLAEREGLKGQVQCIYIDPPYGIKFNSNFQWSTTSRDVKDGKADHFSREPEQVKAFRDTWADGIHSYLTYLRDRLTVARDLLHESGSIFVQIGDENVHRVRALMDEVFGDENFVSLITVWKTSSQTSANLAATSDYLVWYAKSLPDIKYRELKTMKDPKDPDSGAADYKMLWLGNDQRKAVASASEEELANYKVFAPSPTTSQSGGETTRQAVTFVGRTFLPGPGGWKPSRRCLSLGRAQAAGPARAHRCDAVRRGADQPLPCVRRGGGPCAAWRTGGAQRRARPSAALRPLHRPGSSPGRSPSPFRGGAFPLRHAYRRPDARCRRAARLAAARSGHGRGRPFRPARAASAGGGRGAADPCDGWADRGSCRRPDRARG